MKTGDWIKRCEGLRNRIIKKEENKTKYLLANFTGTRQGEDIQDKTPLLQDFFRVKINIKAWDKE